MKDQYFSVDLLGDLFWYEACEAPPVNRSAFVSYSDRPRIEVVGQSSGPSGSGSSNCRNMNKRMVEFLRRNWTPRNGNVAEEHEKERCFRHMINERMRRERQKQSYSALHSMLPYGTKGDKNSIIQMAAMKIQELHGYREELKRRNLELEAIGGGAKIRLRVANPTSGIDSMVEVLKCLKNLGLKTRTIRSNFSPLEFSAELEIENQIGGAAEVEKAIQRTLYEAERKLLHHFEESWGIGEAEEIVGDPDTLLICPQKSNT